jgi:Methyltransferase domain
MGTTDLVPTFAAQFLDSLGGDLGLRRPTVEAALQWVVDHRPSTRLEIVETGIYSGVHGVYPYCSTRIFGKLCQQLGDGRVRSVDIDAKRVGAARELLAEYAEWIEPSVGDSVQWLKGLEGPIHLLHLDSCDYNGNRANRDRSQAHGLREIQTAYSKLAPEAVVLIDDQNMDKAWWPNKYKPGERGKGALAVPWLLQRGWRVLAEDYQIALVRKNPVNARRSIWSWLRDMTPYCIP